MNCQWLERRRLVDEGIIKLGVKSGTEMKRKRSYYRESEPITEENIEEYIKKYTKGYIMDGDE